MDNSFFILSDQQVVISRFHICTWDIENTNSFIEIGIEFKPINEVEFNFRFAAPLVGLNSEVKCLADNLCIDTNNSKFIFNDNVESLVPIDLIKNNYHLCKVENCFCFHVIPNDLNISYVDKKLRNIRELEVNAFKNYLPVELEKMKENRYIIIFNKASNEESYSYFSVFTKEIIGTNQILLAIGTNILCSLLFANATFRSAYNTDISIWEQIPIEFWLAFSILIVVGVRLFYPGRRVK